MTRHNPREPNWEYCVACIIAIVMVWIILSTSVKSYYRELRDQPSPTNTVEKHKGCSMAEYEGTKITELPVIDDITAVKDLDALLSQSFVVLVTPEREYRLSLEALKQYVNK